MWWAPPPRPISCICIGLGAVPVYTRQYQLSYLLLSFLLWHHTCSYTLQFSHQSLSCQLYCYRNLYFWLNRLFNYNSVYVWGSIRRLCLLSWLLWKIPIWLGRCCFIVNYRQYRGDLPALSRYTKHITSVSVMLCKVCLFALLGAREHRFILRNIGHSQTYSYPYLEVRAMVLIWLILAMFLFLENKLHIVQRTFDSF